jgi:histidinol-phosphatase
MYLETALQAVKKAEEIILRYYSSIVNATRKPDRTPVTLADIEAEQVIIETIKTRFPNHSIFGEELGKDIKQSEYTWIIDPIDGTKNFLRHIPLFATQIALLKEGELVLGVSNAPALHELMYAEKGKGAFLNEQKVHVSSINRLADAYMSFTNIKSFQKNNMLSELVALTNSTYTSRSFNDFWGFHLLAQGKIDYYVDIGIKFWDIAALTLIIQEAGGIVTDITGNLIAPSSNSIVATNGLLHDAILPHFLKYRSNKQHRRRSNHEAVQYPLF